MKSSLKWLLVFFAGFFAYRFFLPPASPLRMAPSAPEKPVAAAPKIITKRLDLANTRPLKLQPRSSVAVLQPTPKQIVHVDLSESLVRQMEADWNDLPLEAQARRETRGWRLIRVNENTTFSRAGLRAGDLITTDFLNALKTSDADLVLRVQHILNRITQ